jgi:hypothetical protein
VIITRSAQLRQRRSVGLAATAAAALGLTLAGCALPGQLSASSSCNAFNKASAQAQQNIVVALYHKAHPEEPKLGPGAANAVLNVSYECQSSPTTKLGSLGDFNGSDG